MDTAKVLHTYRTQAMAFAEHHEVTMQAQLAASRLMNALTKSMVHGEDQVNEYEDTMEKEVVDALADVLAIAPWIMIRYENRNGAGSIEDTDRVLEEQMRYLRKILVFQKPEVVEKVNELCA